MQVTLTTRGVYYLPTEKTVQKIIIASNWPSEKLEGEEPALPEATGGVRGRRVRTTRRRETERKGTGWKEGKQKGTSSGENISQP